MIIRPNGNTGRLPSARLPNEYQEVEYIESSGTQYIDTGVNGGSTVNIDIDFEISTLQASGWQCLIGSRNPNYEDMLAFWINYQNYIAVNYNETDSGSTGYTISGRCNLRNDGNKFYNGNTLIYTATSATFSNSYPIYVLGVNQWGSFDRAIPSVKLYGLKLYNNGNLVRNFIPCYRKSDNEIGMYDLVNNVFYTNDGTGTFTKGNDVSLTDLYQEVEYIESSGTQYIDTGASFNTSTKIEMDFYTSLNSNQFLLGARTDSSTNQLYMIYYSSENFRITMLNGVNSVIPQSSVLSHRCKATFDTSQIKLDIEGTQTTYSSTVGSSSTTNLPIYLFTCNTNGSTSLIASMKLYSYKQWTGSTLIRDFIPCYRKSDNVIGLLDLVHNVFYTNSGTGVFTAGDIVKTYEVLNPKIGTGITTRLPSAYQEVEYIESSGTQYIDTGYTPNQDTKIEIDLKSTSSLTSNVFIGARQAFQNKAFYVSQQYGDGSNIGYRFAYGTEVYDVPNTYQDTNRHIFILDKNKAYIDANLVKTFNTQTFISPVNLWAFTNNNNGSSLQPSIIKLYSLKIYNNGTLIRDFIPCYRKSDSAVGLYDIVNNVFYTNAGTGTFSKGNDIESINISKVYLGNNLTYGNGTIYDYGDGSLNTVSGGYNGKLYLNGVLATESNPPSIHGNYKLGMVNGAYGGSIVTLMLSLGALKSRAYIYAGTNLYAQSVDATYEEKNLLLCINAGGSTVGVYLSGFKLVIDGTQYTLEQAVTNELIKPIVLICSGASIERYTWKSALNMYTGGATTSGDFPNMVIFIMINKGHNLTGFYLYSSKNFNTTYDGWYSYTLSTDSARITLNPYSEGDD